MHAPASTLAHETVQARPQPMVYLRYKTKMDSAVIGKQMGEAFGTLGAFVGQNQLAVAGPPLAVYHDYAADGSMTVDVGFPVAAAALGKAKGQIKAGQTPAGKAMKFVHVGPYDRLHETYAEIGAYFARRKLPMSPVCWEVYLSDPDKTAPDELVTEIFMQVP